MRQDLQLGYLVLEVSDLDAWSEFTTTTLGMSVDGAPSEDALRVRMDELQQRFLVRRGPADDVVAVGLTALNGQVLQQILDRVTAAGVPVRECDDQEARDRRVKRLYTFTTPGGITVELVSAPYHSREPLAAPLVPGGFLTGAQGLGHAVFMVDDLDEALRFWTGCCRSACPTRRGRRPQRRLPRRLPALQPATPQRRARAAPCPLHLPEEAAALHGPGQLPRRRGHGVRPRDRRGPDDQPEPRAPSQRSDVLLLRDDSERIRLRVRVGAVEVGEDWAEDHYDHISAWGHRPCPGRSDDPLARRRGTRRPDGRGAR